MKTPRPIRNLPVVDVLIVGLVKQLPNYYSRARRCKFAVGTEVYLHVSDDQVIRHFKFKSLEQREVFLNEWKGYSESHKPNCK